MRYEAGQRFLTSDGRLVELRSSFNVAPVSIEQGFSFRLYFVRACDRQYNISAYFPIKECTMLTKPRRTAFLEHLNTLPYPQKYLDEIAAADTTCNITKYTERVPFGNWLRRNKFREYEEMYAEWEKKQPWFTGDTSEDKFV